MQVIHSPKPGDHLDATTTMYPSRLETVGGDTTITDQTRTTFGYVFSGNFRLEADSFAIDAKPGVCFCIPGGFSVKGEGLVILMTRFGFRGLFGATCVEDRGRLEYIDTCSSTVLIAPPRLGDPVLNHLHIPAGVTQSMHTHPTIRLGVILRGKGQARGRAVSECTQWTEPLLGGSLFLCYPGEVHSFQTSSEDSMDVLTYHPDSDWGPTDQVHPMINRTFLEATNGQDRPVAGSSTKRA